jgi:hypothetical protein
MNQWRQSRLEEGTILPIFPVEGACELRLGELQ